MHMTVHDGLASDLTAVHPDVESFNGLVRCQYVSPHLIQQQVDRPPLWLKQVKVGWGMAAGDDERMQWRNGETVPDGEGKFVLRNPLPL